MAKPRTHRRRRKPRGPALARTRFHIEDKRQTRRLLVITGFVAILGLIYLWYDQSWLKPKAPEEEAVQVSLMQAPPTVLPTPEANPPPPVPLRPIKKARGAVRERVPYAQAESEPVFIPDDERPGEAADAGNAAVTVPQAPAAPPAPPAPLASPIAGSRTMPATTPVSRSVKRPPKPKPVARKPPPRKKTKKKEKKKVIIVRPDSQNTMIIGGESEMREVNADPIVD